MAIFDIAVEKVLVHEGGYTAGLPDDPGGETNHGISKRAYPDLDIKNLSRDEAKVIYLKDYWKPYMAVQTDQHVANCLLDCAVNQGPSAADNIVQVLTHAIGGGVVTLLEVQLRRLLRYVSLVAKKPEEYKYLGSWIRRTLDV